MNQNAWIVENQYIENELTCSVLMESLTASTGTYVPARIIFKRGVRTTAPSVVHGVITTDNGTSPCAI